MRTHPQPIAFSLIALSLLTAACQGDPSVSKLAARTEDPGRWPTDYCASGSWYGDGVCDDFCPAPDPDCKGEQEAAAKDFLDDFTRGYEPLAKAVQLAFWDSATTNSPESYQSYTTATIKLFTYGIDPQRRQTLASLLEGKQQLSLYRRRSLETIAQEAALGDIPASALPQLLKVIQLQNDAKSALNAFRAEFEGRSYSVGELSWLLERDPTPARRQGLWERMRGVGPLLAPKIIEAVKTANAVALSAGYQNSWDYYVRHVLDQDPAELTRLFDELAKKLEAPFRAMKSRLDAETAAHFGITTEQLEIWHYDDAFFQSLTLRGPIDLDNFFAELSGEAVAQLAAGLFAKLGLPIEDVLARSDLLPRKDKRGVAFMLDVDRRGDLRVLLNLDGSFDAVSTAAHELGHAVNYKNLGRKLPFLLRSATHTLTAEAISQFFDAQTLTPEFFGAMLGVKPEVLAILAPMLHEHHRRNELVFARWSMVMFYFEKALYEDPDQDLNALWWELVERYQGIKRPAGRDQPDWACKSHLASSPISYHNYLLGQLYGAQLRATMAQRAGHQGSTLGLSVIETEGAAELLKERVLPSGRELRWSEAIELATGRPLQVDAYVAELTEPQP